MGFLGLFYFVILALFITAAFSFMFKVRGPWGSFWAFFIVLFFAVWAGDIWIEPFGPYWKNIHFVPPLAVGLIIALILAAATPSPTARQQIEDETKNLDNSYIADIAISSFFWITLIFLLAAIIAGIFI